jgi:hypothetical protein
MFVIVGIFWVCKCSLGDDEKTIVEKDNNTIAVAQTLAEITKNANDFVNAAKSIQNDNVYEKPETISNVLDIFRHQYYLLKSILFSFSNLKDIDAHKTRQFVAIEWLSFRMILSESFDTKHGFSIPVYKNLEVNGPYPSGIAPKDIKEPDIRKEYEERLVKNTQLAYERRVQLVLRQLLEDTTKEIEKFICNAYERKPRADQELIDLLEKYKYPEIEKIKLLCKLNIPYKGFRNWESKDKLFKAAARFISLEKDEVNLEKADGKKTSIELSVLRKEDQDYVKKQLESEKKTVDEEKLKKD